MEAKHSQPTGGERSGGPEQSLTEPPLGGRLPQSPSVQHQRVFPSRSHHTPHGRHYHRQPKRSSLERHYHRLQQQQSSTFQLAGKAETEPSAAGPVNRAVWQFTEAPGPSGGSYPSSSTSSSSALHPQIVPPHSSKEAQEGVPRRERKPQKPGKYVCQYCGRPCAKPSVLQKHIRSHTGERPYPCVPCGFSFKTKSNLYKHRKSHAHRIKAGLATGREGYALSGPESGQPGEEQEEPTEGETTDSEEETGQHMSSSSLDTYGRLPSQKSSSVELSAAEEAQRSEDSQAIKQRLAMRLSERKRAPVVVSDDPPSFLSPGSKGSTESGYFSRSESAEQQQVSPPNANAKSYAEIILGKYGRLGQQQRITPQQQQQQPSSSSASEEKGVPFTVPKTQVIEHITKLITINEAVVDTSEIDSVKPRRTSLSRRSSIESPKVSALKEPFLFDTKAELPSSGTSGSMSVGFQGEILHPQFPDVDLLAGQASTVPLLRSHSMPSSAGPGETAGSSSCGIRLSHSFDERQASAAEVRAGALLPPHQRMLKRQPAIEMPLGTEFIPEEAPSSSASSAMVSDPSRKLRRGPRPYECEACGTRYKKRESYETHRRTYCPARLPQETERETGTSAYRVDRPQMMHYKFGATAAAVRKRRKEKSLGDEEEPPVFESSPAPAATSFPPSSTCIPRREENRPAAETVSREGPLSTSSQTEQDRRTTWKEISVIQHTSSFEKQDVPVESQENEEKIVIPPPREEHQQQTQQQPSKPPSFSKLVRQSNIQVPEILVTEEPDPDVVLASPPATATTKEPEKVEEFQWPQRSQSLAQLPAEKLPPKKKRLRLAEAAQSSGESSFESISLPRSPSQESSLSHTSSRSASFEESGKPDIETQPASTRTSQVTHMLTVPSGHHQHHQPHREMRRSASEQAPTSAQHPAQIAEVRSKSFDYGCLSPQCSSAAWRERRKCLLVRQATLGEPEPEDQPPGRPTKATPQVCLSYHSPAAPPVEPSTASSTSVPEPMSKSLQLFQPPLPLSRDLQPVFPLHPPAPVAITQGQIPQLYPTAGISEVLSAQIGPHSFLQTAPQLRPGQLHIAERLGLPVQQYPPLLPLQYPTGAAQALYLPVPSGLALQMPPEPFRESKPSPSSQGPGPQHPRPVIAPSLEQLRPVVSLVVPVRIQTHVPTYASAMYTTLSQILVTRAQESARSAVVLCKLEEEKLQNPYLKIPTPDFKSYLPMTLPLESVAGMGSEDVLGPSPAGGNKRMLSPAGSLELSAEAQRQQKRVKEEEEEEEEGEGRQEKVRAEAAMEREREDKEKAEKTEETKEEQKAALGKGDQFKEEEGEESQVNIPRVRSPDSRKGPSFPSLHTTTSVSWCYLNYIKPNPSTLRDPQTSVYSSWCISVHNPNLPGLSTKTTLSLLRSKQKHSTETYTMATTHRPTSGKLVPANSRKPRMAEIHAAPVSISAEVKETAKPEKEEEKRSKREEEASTSKRSEPSRIRIFEGGYKSNEEYVYVRGRGRGKYVCEECGIRCKKPSMLKKHIRTHTDVRPYVCKYCNFAFKTKGNLTKHMKSKAHGKKCQEMGVSGSSLDELEAEEGGGSEERAGGSEDQEEHQFSDVDDSEDDDENEEEEEEEESSSHEDPPSSCSPDTRHSTGGRSDSGQQPQHDAPESTLPPAQEKEPVARQKDYPSPRRHWPTAREASPGSRRALFSRRRWEASPRAFSPSSEGSPLRCLSPGQGLSPVRPVSPGREVSPLRCLSPRLEVSSPSRHLSPSPERGPSPIRPRSPSRYLAPRTLPTPAPTEIPTSFQRAHSSTPFPAGQAPRDTPSTEASQSRLEKIYFPREGLSSPECYSFPPAPRLPHSASDFPGHAPGRPGDHVFSHLPLHSQQLSRTPYLMIPIGGIQMVQPRPSSHASLAQGPAAALSSPRGTAGGAGRPAGTREAAPGGSPGPSTDAPAAERAPGERRAPEDDRVQESAAGTSLSGLCTGRQGTASASQAPQEDVSQAGGDEPPDAGTKQYGSSRTYSPTSTLAAATAAQTADRGPGATSPGVPPASQPASSTPRTPQLSGEEGPPAGRHRRRGPELAGGSTAGSAQNKDGKPGST